MYAMAGSDGDMKPTRNATGVPSPSSTTVLVDQKWSRNRRGRLAAIGRPHQSSTTRLIHAWSSGRAVRTIVDMARQRTRERFAASAGCQQPADADDGVSR